MNTDTNLEQRIQTAFDFDEIDIEIEDWNTPSHEVWEEIEGKLQKKKRRIAFWWLASSFGVLSVLALLFFNGSGVNQNSIKTETETIPVFALALDTNTKTNNSNISLSNNNTLKTNNNHTNDLILFSENKNNKDVNFSNRKQQKNNTQNIFSPIEGNKNTIYTTSFSSKNEVMNKKVEKANDSEAIVAISRSSFSIENLETLFPKYLNIATPKTIISSLKLLPITKKAVSKSPLHLSITAAPFALRNRIKGDITNFEGEKFDNAYTIGLNITKPLKKTFIEAGIGISQVNYTLKYDIALPFNGTGEIQNKNGNFDNTYNGSVPTSLGSLDMQMVLARQSGHSVAQGEAIPLSAKGKERLTFLTIPLSWGANVRLSPKSYLSGKLIFSNIILLRSTTQFENVISHHDGVKETSTTVQTSPKPNSWTPFVGANIGVHYALTEKWNLGANTFLHQSISPILKNDTYRNSPYFIGGGINLEYKF